VKVCKLSANAYHCKFVGAQKAHDLPLKHPCMLTM